MGFVISYIDWINEEVIINSNIYIRNVFCRGLSLRRLVCIVISIIVKFFVYLRITFWFVVKVFYFCRYSLVRVKI